MLLVLFSVCFLVVVVCLFFLVVVVFLFFLCYRVSNARSDFSIATFDAIATDYVPLLTPPDDNNMYSLIHEARVSEGLLRRADRQDIPPISPFVSPL